MGFPDSPVELPNGKLVCEDHGLEICYQCCCDYTPLNEDHEHRQSIKECSVSSEDVPDIIFRMAESATNVLQGAAARSIADVQASEYCEDCQLTWMTATLGSAEGEPYDDECPHHDSIGGTRAEQRKIIVYIDGACPGNGTQTAFGGVGVYFGPSSFYNLSAPLIDSKTVKPPTSQKAELQAAASALQIIRNDCMPARRQLLKQFLKQCACHTECWAAGSPFQVVLVTDSAYLFDCITSHLLIWRWDSETRQYSYKKSGNVIKNSEHIRNIVEEVGLLAERGLQVLWKKVPRESNQEADRLAKAGAESSRTSSATTRRSSVV